MQNFSVVAEIRKGFARRGPLGFGDGDSQGFPTLTLRALRMETEITRDRYFLQPSLLLADQNSSHTVLLP